MMREWIGRRYWLVGAEGGLGRALAMQLSRVGTGLVLSAPARGPLEALAEELPGRAEALPIDIGDMRAVESAAARAGEIDGLIYLADLRRPLTAREWDVAAFEAMAQVNLLGAARLLGAVLPEMVARRAGHVVIGGAPVAARRARGAMGYAATKAAAMDLARSLRHELRGSGVAVQMIACGPVRGRRGGGGIDPEDAARRAFEHMCGEGFRADIGGLSAWPLLGRLAG